MPERTPEIVLFPGEEVIECHVMPPEAPAPAIGADLLVELMSANNTQMPVASRALDLTPGQGRFEAEFARDALVMSQFVSTALPEVTLNTVRRLAQVQGLVDCTEGGLFSDREEPGRIPHEIRQTDDPIAIEYSQQFGWQWPYFGSVDATPLFISACARALHANPELLSESVMQHDGVTRSIREVVENATAWLERKLRANSFGFLASTAASNACWQVWMDSPDAYHHADGVLARGSVAAIEVQGFTYDALLAAARLAHDGLLNLSENYLWTLAQRLRRSVITHMWIASPGSAGYFATGAELNGDTLRPFAVQSANMGLLLDSTLLDGSAYTRFVEGITAQLQNPNGLWSVNGIRTLAKGQARFRATSYHNGSVWPWQNLAIARGLRRHGKAAFAMEVENRMLEVVDELGCMPEFVVGDDDMTPRMNTAQMRVISPDGHGGHFEHELMSIPQRHQGWTAFGIYALETATAAKSAAA